MSEAPEMVWIVEPNKVNGTAFTYTTSVPPERVEYIRADVSAARIADLERQLAEARDKALDEAAVEMELAAHIVSHHGSDTEVQAYTNAAKAIRNMKGTP